MSLARVRPGTVALLAIVVLAILVRLALGPLAGPRNVLSWNQVTYLELGVNIAAGRGYWSGLAPNALPIQAASHVLLPLDDLPHDFAGQYRPIEYFLPSYAYLIAPAIAATGRHDWGVVQTFNALVDGLAGPLVTYALVSWAGGGQFPALLAALLYASSPTIAATAGLVIPDSLSSLLSVLPLACVAAGRRVMRRGWAAGLCGICIAVGCGFRGEIVALVPLLAMVVFVTFGRRWKTRLGLAALVVVGWVVGTAPLSLFWNQVYGFPAISRPGVGVRLWEGIGGFPNPWGVEATDPAAGALLTRNGLAYGTSRGDAFLVRESIAHFEEDPLFLVMSAVERGRAVLSFGVDGWGEFPVPFADQKVRSFEVGYTALFLIGVVATLRRQPMLFGLLACLWISRAVPFSFLEVQARDLIPLQVAYMCWVACGLAALIECLGYLGKQLLRGRVALGHRRQQPVEEIAASRELR